MLRLKAILNCLSWLRQKKNTEMQWAKIWLICWTSTLSNLTMFKGTFYNHQVAAAHKVMVRIFDESLQFDKVQDGMPSHRYHWLFTEINIEVNNSRFMRIVNNTEDGGSLEITDPEFIKMFLGQYKRTRSIGLHGLILHSGVQLGIAAMVIIIGLALLAHFIVLPWCADKVVDRLPRSFDKELGMTAMRSMNEDKDTVASELLTKFAAQMQWDSPDSLTFTVVPGDIENAYALPGGYIFVYTGLLEKLQQKEELAALLSHEVAHVTCRHSVRGVCRDMSSAVVLSLILTNSGSLTSALVTNANALYGLTYSRKYEEQADIVGMQTMRRNHIDQQGMLQLMEILQKLSKDTRVPEFISTHPLTKNRINYVRNDIKEHPGKVNEHAQMESLFHQLKALSKK
ncbi:M48 family metallopeptidase [Chitinophaga rhizophila]|uniref:M48 family metallopeptidase n=1 Tax=Chitinophaga rhizophila TaxID=2866212 RepID=A0ABS7G5G6_9BACT|nr:M48 family metallopeptidase [Chitinophaga rhizophila]MBW8682898.1 M48 family metallopeptidase [Chitinophaga rhizophila]